MIAPMTRYTFLVYHESYNDFLHGIRNLGVLHLVEKEKDVSDSTLEKYGEIKEIGDVVRFLISRNIEQVKSDKGTTDGQEALKEVRTLQDELESKKQQLTHLRKEINYAAPWGDFSVETIKKLKEAGLGVRFFTVKGNNYDPEWENQYPIKVVGQQAGLNYVVAICPSCDQINFEKEDMRQPERPISELEFYQQKLNEDIASLNLKLDEHAKKSIEAIKEVLLEKRENLNYDKALFNTQKVAEEKVMLLEGWVPNENKEALGKFLDNNNILHIEAKPNIDDSPPVKLKNSKFAKKFEPIGELYTLPTYNEMDLTPFFAPFYLLFFGFCLGDAGYGILMAIVALFARRKVAVNLKPVLNLVFYLALSTIAFGLIGGTFFGVPLYETSLPVYRTIAANLEAQGTNVNNLMFVLALAFGAVQIIFGMVLKAINEIRMFGWGFAIGTSGWILLILGFITMAAFNKFGDVELDELRIPFYVLLAVSGTMILPLNNLGRNLLLNTGIGLWNTYNMVTGLLGDLLSYIRLFALGISSAIMGFVFNSLAVSMSGDIPVVSWIIMIIILVVGHSLNIFMSGLAAFVHPLRLTFVEFYKNAGFIGGGKKYEPFKKLT